MPPKQHPMPNLALQTMPGLEQVAWRELRALGLDASSPSYLTVPRRNGVLMFTYESSPADLLRLHCAEDLFAVFVRAEITVNRQALDTICSRLRSSIGRLYNAMAIYEGLGRARPRRRGEPIRFRVIARLSGDQHTFPRQTLRRHIEAAIQQATRSKWLAVPDGEDVELWCSVCGSQVLAALRLSDATMRQRDYKKAHLPASLRPSVAAAMALLSQPQDDDTVLDPMCGAGTILIERAMMGRYEQLVGIDLAPQAVEAARLNFGRRHKPRQILLADAQHIPLTSESVTKIVCNLPFGKQIARPEDLPKLYRRSLREFGRVMQPGGRCVLLTSAAGLLRRLALAHGRLYLIESHKVLVLGQRAEITVWGLA